MARGMRLRPRQRGLDGLAEHEMIAHQPHRLPRRRPHRRRAQPLRQPSDGSCGVSPGWITRADIPSAHAEALTRKALDLVS